MEKKSITKKILTVLRILVAAVCIFGLCKPMTSVELHEKSIKSLEEKEKIVMELTSVSTAASVAVSMMPGDTATPIADKLADLSSYFLVILSAIFLEKYLVTVTGYASFLILFPLACVFLIAYIWIGNERLKYLAKKMTIFGILIIAIIPISVRVSDVIESAYETSIEDTIESTRENVDEISKNEKEQTKGKEEGFLSGLWSKVGDSVTGTVDKFEEIFNNLMESIAVMLVTSCLVPILIFVFFIWMIKMYLNIPISINSVYMVKDGWKNKKADKE